MIDNEDNKNGFKIVLEFSENPFFENEMLIVEILHGKSLDDTQLTATEIKWKTGKKPKVWFVGRRVIWKDSE